MKNKILYKENFPLLVAMASIIAVVSTIAYGSTSLAIILSPFLLLVTLYCWILRFYSGTFQYFIGWLGIGVFPILGIFLAIGKFKQIKPLAIAYLSTCAISIVLGLVIVLKSTH